MSFSTIAPQIAPTTPDEIYWRRRFVDEAKRTRKLEAEVARLRGALAEIGKGCDCGHDCYHALVFSDAARKALEKTQGE